VPERFSQDGAAALHAVQDTRLRTLMNEMKALLFERMPTELEIDRERSRKAAQIADVADSMSRTVDDIVQSLPRLSLQEDEKTVFLVMAGRLRQQVATLQAQARSNYIDSIPGTMEQISATCDGCHQLFRDPIRRDIP
jgi:cytochrome c556